MSVTFHTRRRPLWAEPLENRITPAGDLLRTLANPDPAAAGDQFGTVVATDGQFIAVGNPFDDVGGSADAGSVSVFNLATGQLVRTIPNPAPGTGDQFGFSIVIFNGDCWIGAPFDDPGGRFAFRASVRFA